MALQATGRSPPDGKSSPPSLADASVIIPGFLSKSSQLNLALPSPAAVPLKRAARTPKPAPRTSKASAKSAKDPFGNWSNGQPSPEHFNSPSPQTKPSPANIPINSSRSSEMPQSNLNDSSAKWILSSGTSPENLRVQKLVSTPVSGVLQTTRSGSVHGTRKMAKALHISKVSGETRSVAKPATERAIPESPSEQQTPEKREDSMPLSPISPTSIPHRASPDIPPYFIHPLNLCDPFVDNIGLVEICSLRVNELRYLSQTNQNKPVFLKDRRSVPSYLVRIWSRGSGRYLDILSVGELYGRGLFGHNERLRLVVVGQRTVMIQSTKDSRLHIGIQNGVVTGKGDGGQDCHFIIHQGPTGYCLLESLLSPGSFLGVRKNGNIIRPSQVNPNSTEARFVIQKETLGALM